LILIPRKDVLLIYTQVLGLWADIPQRIKEHTQNYSDGDSAACGIESVLKLNISIFVFCFNLKRINFFNLIK